MSFGSKHMWYITGAAVLIALLAWALLQRDVLTSIGIGNQQATSTETSTDTSGGTTASSNLPSGWPSDAPALLSGAKITYSGQSDPKTEIAGPTVVFTASSKPQTAVTFYKSQFTAHGWTFRGQGDDLGSVQLAATKGTRKVTVTILETRSGVLNVTIGISKLGS